MKTDLKIREEWEAEAKEVDKKIKFLERQGGHDTDKQPKRKCERAVNILKPYLDEIPNLTLNEIKDKTDLSITAISRALKILGVSYKKNTIKHTNKKITKYRDWCKDKSAKEIAKFFGVSVEHARYICKEYNIEYYTNPKLTMAMRKPRL